MQVLSAGAALGRETDAKNYLGKECPSLGRLSVAKLPTTP